MSDYHNFYLKKAGNKYFCHFSPVINENKARQSGPRWPKSPSLMTSLTKNPQPPSKKIFFECRLEDLLHLLRQFTGSVRHTGPKKFPRKATCV